MQCLHRAAELDNTIGYYVGSFILCAYYGFATCFYGIGELNIPFMEETSRKWKERVPDGSFFHIGTGALEMSKGNFDQAIEHFKISIPKQQFWPQMHFICFWSQSWCYAYVPRPLIALLSRPSNKLLDPFLHWQSTGSRANGGWLLLKWFT
jgi:hypothetical protein